MNIKTEFWAKPAPVRNWDWTAIDSDTYDGAPDAGPISRCIGYGKTEADAVADLEEQLEDARVDALLDEEPLPGWTAERIKKLQDDLIATNAELAACNKRLEDREAYRVRMEEKYCDDKAGE